MVLAEFDGAYTDCTVGALEQAGCSVSVVLHDELSAQRVAALGPLAVVLPGLGPMHQLGGG